MTEQDILLWAAGREHPLPLFHGAEEPRVLSLLGLSQENFVKLIDRHRMGQRFLHRFAQQRPSWCNSNLLDWMSYQQQVAQVRLGAQIKAVEQIQQALPPRKSPLLVLKGCSAYALTGGTHFLRFTGDIDLCYDDLGLLWDVMYELGYRGKRHYTYEYAKLKRDGVTIDLHNYYPIYSYPAATQEYINLGQLQEYEWQYKDLIEHCVAGRASGTTGVHVLDLHATMLLLSAHSFRNFVTDIHYLDETFQIRLAEFADIADLSLQPDFDAELFKSLTNRYYAQDCVSFVEEFLNTYEIPHRPLIATEKKRTTFPENLMCGGWVSLCHPESWMQPRNAREALTQLGAQPYIVNVKAEDSNIAHQCQWIRNRNMASLLFDDGIECTKTDNIAEEIGFCFELEKDDLCIKLSLAKERTNFGFTANFGGDCKIEINVQNSQIKDIQHKDICIKKYSVALDSSNPDYLILAFDIRRNEIAREFSNEIPALFAVKTPSSKGIFNDFNYSVQYFPSYLILN